jgi:hypothetical protein
VRQSGTIAVLGRLNNATRHGLNGLERQAAPRRLNVGGGRSDTAEPINRMWMRSGRFSPAAHVQDEKSSRCGALFTSAKVLGRIELQIVIKRGNNCTLNFPSTAAT